MIESTEIKLSLTVEEARSLLTWLSKSHNRDYSFRGFPALANSKKDDCERLRVELDSLMLTEPRKGR